MTISQKIDLARIMIISQNSNYIICIQTNRLFYTTWIYYLFQKIDGFFQQPFKPIVYLFGWNSQTNNLFYTKYIFRKYIILCWRVAEINIIFLSEEILYVSETIIIVWTTWVSKFGRNFKRRHLRGRSLVEVWSKFDWSLVEVWPKFGRSRIHIEPHFGHVYYCVYV